MRRLIGTPNGGKQSLAKGIVTRAGVGHILEQTWHDGAETGDGGNN